MKKILCFTVLFSLFFLTGCSLFDGSNDSSGYEDLENSTPDVTIDENKHDLGNGDLVWFEEASTNDLNDTYEALTDAKEGEVINTYYQTKYEQGLLDFFDLEKSIKIKIIISKNQIKALNEDHKVENRETYRMCNLEITYNGLVFFYKEVGIRQKGNTSRGLILDGDNINLRHYKLSFSETFDGEDYTNKRVWESEEARTQRKDRTFFGLEKLDLRWNRLQDQSYIREYSAYETYRKNGVLAPRSNVVNVVMDVDGSEENAGLYLAVETIDNSFIKRNMIKDARGGDLYKVGWGYSPENGDPLGGSLNIETVNDMGVNEQVKNGNKYREIQYIYDLKTNKKTSEHKALKALINGINDTNNIEEFVKNNFEYSNFITFLALEYLIGDPDDFRGNYNNYYIYLMGDSNKAIFIPTDCDRSFGITTKGGNGTKNGGAETLPLDKKIGYSENNSLLLNSTIINGANKNITDDFLARINELIKSEYFSYDTFVSRYNKVINKYGPSVITLGKKIVDGDLSLSMTAGVEDVSTEENMPIKFFLERKKATFNEYLNPGNEEDDNDEKEDISNLVFYLRGSFNEWGVDTMTLSEGKYSITITLGQNTMFKIGTESWDKSYGFSSVTVGNDLIVPSTDENGNISILNNGSYTITFDLSTATISIVLNQ